MIPVSTGSEPAASSQATSRTSPRNRNTAIDLLRTVGLLRIVAWHAVAATWLTWMLPAVPLLFFCSGLLMGAVDRPWAGVLPDRLRRILVPLWLYGLALALAVLVLGWFGAAPVVFPTWQQVLPWILPLADPVSPGADGGWLSSHLWYLRAHVWFLLLAPLLFRLARRPVVSGACLALAVVVLEVAVHLVGAGRVVTLTQAVGDFACYGFFVVLGIAVRRRGGSWPGSLLASRRGRSAALLGACLLMGGAAGWACWSWLDGGAVTASWILLLLTGGAWILALTAAARPLAWIADREAVGRVTSAVSGRAMTIYIWHPVAILLAGGLLGVTADDRKPLTVLGLTLVFTAAAVLLLGWVEDLAADRAPKILPWSRSSVPRRLMTWRRPAAVLAVAASVIVLVAVQFSGGRALAVLPPPSARDTVSSTAFNGSSPGLAPRATPFDALPADVLEDALMAWGERSPMVDGAEVTVVSGLADWSGNYTRDGSAPTNHDTSLEWLSVGKTVTATLVLRAVGEGKLALDAPAPVVDGLHVTGRTPTVRELLTHSSGLINPSESPTWDYARDYSTAEYVNLALDQPRADGYTYSTANYIWLALAVESVTGSDWPQLVQTLAEEAGTPTLRAGKPDQPGWVGLGSGDITASAVDITRFFDELLVQRSLLSPQLSSEMTRLNSDNIGLGVWPYCPCWTDADGARRADGFGHYAYEALVVAYPAQKVTIAIRPRLAYEDPYNVSPSGVTALAQALEGR